MERGTLFNNVDDFEREVYRRSDFDSLFDTASIVDRRRCEQMENRVR